MAATAAAVSCSLVSRGCCVSNHAVSAQAAVVGSSSAGSRSFAWDPLHRRHAMLRSSSSSSSRSAFLSSCAPSTSFASTRDSTAETRRARGGVRLVNPRASNNGDGEETEQITEITGSEDRLHSNVEESTESSQQNVWSLTLASAAKPAVVAVMMALLLAQPVEDAFAGSSGGRMGGKSFSSPRPSAPSRSYSGGGGGGGGRAYSGGGGGGVYVAPPLYGSPYGSPFGYSPFYGGGYGGGLFLGPSIGFGGGGSIILAIVAFATLRAVAGFIRDRFRGDEDDRFDD